ncbi:alkaline phosphatase family protein [Acidobacterium sp. S8]|uniref:alkaline phosphatase family protein n=1 Tax=Acidobacterium sp. S8 TaxID=1641854 RepID=UPI0020B11120|nr:alkaline phosphatase family protein [Acidobacterium sp. S8]
MTPPSAPTVSITSSATTIAPGQSATLSVTATNASQVVVAGTDGSSYTLPANGGSQVVTPTATTTYTATASGNGMSATALTKITISASPAPTVAITASPASIAPGDSSVLTVTAANATQVTISGSDGSSYSLPATGGTQSVTPTATATYTATATGAGGSTTATATVTVTATPPPGTPTVTITPSPTAVTPGQSSTLTVTATNSTQVTIAGSDGSSYTLQPTGGTQLVTPMTTTTYTATATGAGGTVTAKATVTVTPNPPPTVIISANPTAITQGSSSLLTVTATNATQVTITGSDKSSYTLPGTGGAQPVSPAATTTYTATATGPGGTITATATVTVTPNPIPTVTMTASPASVTAGNSSTLTVSSANATTVTITGNDGSSYTLASANGAQAVTPAKTTTYTATATGPGGSANATATVTVTPDPIPTVNITANPTTIIAGNTSTLTITATNATQVTVAGSDGTSYSIPTSGGSQPVTPAKTTIYTATATGAGGSVTNSTTVTVTPAGTVQSIDHVVFMLQENHTFDNYFGMLNPYRKSNNYYKGDDGKEYDVDGIDDKLTTISNVNDEGTSYALFKLKSTCVDDMSSDWLASFGDVNRYNFLTDRPIVMDGFVHNAEGYATSCKNSTSCSGTFTDTAGQRSMGYYDEGYLNYYYYMASQFALSDRWFSPIASKSIDNRIATFTGGTTQGLVKDPGGDDHLTSQLAITTIFEKLDNAKVSWKIYYTVTQGFCLDQDDCTGGPSARYPATDFSNLSYSYQYLHENTPDQPCVAPTVPSSAVGDDTNSFCIDTDHIAPLSQYYSDVNNGTLPSFAFIEAGYGNNDEHPGSGQSVLMGQAQVANIVNTFMKSPSWKDSVFFLSYDEGGGPYEHVPPVPNHSNDNTSASLGTIPDISGITVSPDTYKPCIPTGAADDPSRTHCDLSAIDPGANSGDAAAQQGFAAQLGFRLPNIVISPFTRRHYVSHIPMDHTAVIKFVENRFIGSSAHLTARDAAQPALLDFFDFDNIPWATPPAPPTPVTAESLGTDPCTPTSMGP